MRSRMLLWILKKPWSCLTLSKWEVFRILNMQRLIYKSRNKVWDNFKIINIKITTKKRLNYKFYPDLFLFSLKKIKCILFNAHRSSYKSTTNQTYVATELQNSMPGKRPHLYHQSFHHTQLLPLFHDTRQIPPSHPHPLLSRSVWCFWRMRPLLSTPWKTILTLPGSSSWYLVMSFYWIKPNQVLQTLQNTS